MAHIIDVKNTYMIVKRDNKQQYLISELKTFEESMSEKLYTETIINFSLLDLLSDSKKKFKVSIVTSNSKNSKNIIITDYPNSKFSIRVMSSNGEQFLDIYPNTGLHGYFDNSYYKMVEVKSTQVGGRVKKSRKSVKKRRSSKKSRKSRRSKK